MRYKSCVISRRTIEGREVLPMVVCVGPGVVRWKGRGKLVGREGKNLRYREHNPVQWVCSYPIDINNGRQSFA